MCIEKTPGYDIQNANYGQMCKNRESMLAFDRWFYGGDVGQCIEEQRMAEQTAEVEAGLRDVEMDETPCSIGKIVNLLHVFSEANELPRSLRPL